MIGLCYHFLTSASSSCFATTIGSPEKFQSRWLPGSDFRFKIFFQFRKKSYFRAGVSPLQAAPFNPPGAEASKGIRLSAVLEVAYPFFYTDTLPTGRQANLESPEDYRHYRSWVAVLLIKTFPHRLFLRHNFLFLSEQTISQLTNNN